MFGQLRNWLSRRPARDIPTANAPKNIDDFVQFLSRSEVTTAQQAIEYVAQFNAEHPEAIKAQKALDKFCDYLICTGLVTAWQCKKLRLGRWKGFYMDNYLLLEQVPYDQVNLAYKARDSTTGDVVCVVIPPHKYTGGPIPFDVEPYSE
jgi:hypothetical protein